MHKSIEFKNEEECKGTSQHRQQTNVKLVPLTKSQVNKTSLKLQCSSEVTGFDRQQHSGALDFSLCHALRSLDCLCSDPLLFFAVQCHD